MESYNHFAGADLYTFLIQDIRNVCRVLDSMKQEVNFGCSSKKCNSESNASSVMLSLGPNAKKTERRKENGETKAIAKAIPYARRCKHCRQIQTAFSGTGFEYMDESLIIPFIKLMHYIVNPVNERSVYDWEMVTDFNKRYSEDLTQRQLNELRTKIRVYLQFHRIYRQDVNPEVPFFLETFKIVNPRNPKSEKHIILGAQYMFRGYFQAKVYDTLSIESVIDFVDEIHNVFSVKLFNWPIRYETNVEMKLTISTIRDREYDIDYVDAPSKIPPPPRMFPSRPTFFERLDIEKWLEHFKEYESIEQLQGYIEEFPVCCHDTKVDFESIFASVVYIGEFLATSKHKMNKMFHEILNIEYHPENLREQDVNLKALIPALVFYNEQSQS